MAIGATGLSFVGIGKETTKGTAVAVGAGGWIPATSMDGDDTVDILRDEGMRASMATLYGSVPGVKSSSFSLEGDAYVDTLGFMLAGMFGSTATTGAGPFVHTFSLKNSGDGQCRSYTMHDYNGLQGRKYAGCQESSLSLRLAAQELFTYSSAWSGYVSATESTPTPSFGALLPIAGWTGVVTLAGSTNALMEEMDLTFSRNVTPVFTVDGNQDPAIVWQGAISVSGRLMLLASDETEFARYLAGTATTLVISLTQSTASLVLTMSSVIYTSAKIERGDDFSQVSVQFEAQANSTDAGVTGGLAPIKAVLTNSVASGTYD